MNWINFASYTFRFLILLALGSCISPFEPPSVAALGYLVVDGHAYVEEGIAVVRLSRSQKLTDDATPITEKKAKVQLEDEFGAINELTEYANGVYSVSGLALEYGRKYRVNITTSNANQYTSAYLASQKTPEIEELKLERSSAENFVIKLNTKDVENKIFFFKWDFNETWEYVSGARSSYIFERKVQKFPKDTVYVRDTNIYNCWQFSKSKSILVNSSKKLNAAVVSDFILQTIPIESKKLDKKYSILVSQYAISEEEYNYNNELKKNTETTGSIFDPQPTELTGNLQCTNNKNEVVIGFFSTYSVTQKRLKVSYSDLNPDWSNFRLRDQCFLDSFLFDNLGRVPLSYYLVETFNVRGTPVGYTATLNTCADCRSGFNGSGTNIEPEYMKK